MIKFLYYEIFQKLLFKTCIIQVQPLEIYPEILKPTTKVVKPRKSRLQSKLEATSLKNDAKPATAKNDVVTTDHEGIPLKNDVVNTTSIETKLTENDVVRIDTENVTIKKNDVVTTDTEGIPLKNDVVNTTTTKTKLTENDVAVFRVDYCIFLRKLELFCKLYIIIYLLHC